MKKTIIAKNSLKRTRDKRLKTIYDNDPEIRGKVDEIVDLLYKVLCRASTGADSKDSITVGQLCRGLNRFGFKTSKDQLIDNILVLNDVKDTYKLELIHTKGNVNVTNTHYPPISGLTELNTMNLNKIDRETLKKIFLNVGLKLSLGNTIY
ncbi:hypothetical protein MACK_003849 [Theileria orientalis]|uniref:Uncharacterized protein n=1 Tax=Theileria orientalis TaxID=68886 RepID=A0A976XJC5_THEOR|nr:hypothetical protein MACK_003849 [Theileria orientalis]